MTAYKSEEETVNEYLSSHGKIIARNCRVEDLDVIGAVLGGSWAGEVSAQVTNVRRSGNEMNLQLQTSCSDALKCVRLKVYQSGVNVEAKAEEAVCTASEAVCTASWKATGFDFPITVPVAANDNSNGYGVSRLFFTTSRLQNFTVRVAQLLQDFTPRVAQSASSSFDEFLSEEERIIAHNVNLSDLQVTGAILGGAWSPNTSAQVECIKREATKMCLQLQARCSDYLKGVHVTLRQVGSNVAARVDWAAAVSRGKCGFDFSAVKHVPIAETPPSEGYGVSRLSLKRKSLVHVGTYVGSTIQVRISPDVDVNPNSVRVGLHWIDGENYGGWIMDRGVCVRKTKEYWAGKGYRDEYLMAEFMLDEVAERIAGLPRCPSRLFPVVFFTDDGTYDNAWYRTTFEGAKHTAGMVIALYPKHLQYIERLSRTYRKELDRKECDPKRQALAVPKYICIDGNNVVRCSCEMLGNKRGWLVLKTLLDWLRRNGVKHHLYFDSTAIHLEDGGHIDADGMAYVKSLLDDKSLTTLCPSRDEADKFILHYADATDGHVVANDGYSQWVGEYPWIDVKNHTGKVRRIHKFVVVDGQLQVPDLGILETIATA